MELPITFTVIATNANGNSLPSSASNSVTPSTVPGAPTVWHSYRRKCSGYSNIYSARKQWGSAITGYTVTSILVILPARVQPAQLQLQGLLMELHIPSHNCYKSNGTACQFCFKFSKTSYTYNNLRHRWESI